MLKIGIRNFAGDDWTGGGTYLKNLLQAIRAVKNEEVQVSLLVFKGASTQSYEPFRDYISDVIEIPPLDESKLVYKLKYKIARRLRLSEVENGFSTLLRNKEISAVFATDTFGDGFKIPLFFWVQDLQPLRMPNFFSTADVQAAKNSIEYIVKSSNKVVLSSISAQHDFEYFFPEYRSKIKVLKFVAQVPQFIYDRDPSWICDQYDLPERFFYLPNQFWVHKNHLAVIEALVLAKKAFPEIAIVCTGNTNDFRDRLYFSKMLTKIAELKLRNNFFILGLVPHEHVYWLMRQSVGIIQPSFFEGWSTTVEEAKSLGKNIILSDIEVHREQNPPDARYFNPENIDLLAGLLRDEFENRKPGPSWELENQARASLHERTIEFGNYFLQILKTKEK